MASVDKATIRFLAVSDIHNSWNDGIDPTGYDAMIVAGDFKWHGRSSCKEKYRSTVNDDAFFKWCNAHPGFPVLLIPGNRVYGEDYDTPAYLLASIEFRADGTIGVVPAKGPCFSEDGQSAAKDSRP